MATYLHSRNGHFYLRLRVPSDLPSVFPSREILKSLHTKDKKTAKLTAAVLRPRLLEVFALTRCGFITEEQARDRIQVVLGKQPAPLPSSTRQTEEPQHVHQPNEDSSPTLQAVIQEYTEDRSSAWTAKTRLEYESYYRLILDVVGNRKVSLIDRSTVRDLRDTLKRLPANLYKKHPKKTIKQVLSLPDIRPMSTTTVNKMLTLFGGLMIHCVKEGYRKNNPAEGLKVKQHRKAQDERKAYSHEDLKRIVQALPSPSSKPERYWVPMIGMYSGMRLGEICGLHVSDVKQVDGVWCFDVNEEGDKRLKTESSNRIIPIHQRLIDLGLLKFVESMKERKSVRLWPALFRRDTDGYCPALGNWYGRFNRKHITDDPLKTFHSLRHTFADTLKQLGCQESLISELMGHANDSITTGRYGKRYQPKVLLEAVSMICY
ncbi:site-specific integrase [Geomonas oryzae]|uniref:site-specific integrase n=1 Tax=Geomonas oryzae TaxID=2364273 RepID=UPI00100BE259|nr:site-specific integrase [Geomonas oryzae]